MTSEPILIAGGGIGGLAAALALAGNDRRVIVLEREARLEAVGAGLQLSPNAVHALRSFGIGSTSLTRAVRPDAIRILSGRSGEDIARVPLGATAEMRYGTPYLVVHRADLQSALVEAVATRPEIELRLGLELCEATQDDNGVTAEAQTADGPVRVTGAALIGADGVWSTVRRRALRLRQAAFSGRTAYRATVPIDGVDPQWHNVTGLWLGRDTHLVHYPVENGRTLNIVAIVAEAWSEEGWSHPVDASAVLNRFADWPDAARTLLSRAGRYLRWALCSMDPGAIWIEGRIGLLGDAAHAMLPFAAQGAGMAIEDAAALAAAFDQIEDVPAALARYEALRRDRAERVLRFAQRNGGIYHMGSPVAQVRDAILKRIPPERLLSRLDWLYGWKPPSSA